VKPKFRLNFKNSNFSLEKINIQPMGKTDKTEKDLPSPTTEAFDQDSPENSENKGLEAKGD
jgi:hypothetical protein